MFALIAIWALAEATLFFIVADVPIMALGIKAGLRKALIGAGIAAVFSAIGGSAIWIWASTNSKDVIEAMLTVPAIDLAMIGDVCADWEVRGPLGMMIGSFSGVPYKLYALAAGDVAGKSLPGLAVFFLASIAARLPRFLLVAAIAGWIGPKLRLRFGAGAVWIAFFVSWALFYAAYWTAMGF